ncbi:MAG: glycosyltransferase family 9 protein [Deltaproteobacteria bacterium]|nr:glycosyltransferase family 9 protein [Deltaproteobacteria bacterium]
MKSKKQILVHLGSGFGNILMATPMMEMLSRGGYQVDLCLQGETPGVEKLFENWPFVRTVSSSPETFVSNSYAYYIYGDEVQSPPIKFVNQNKAIVLHPVWDIKKSFELYSEIEMYTNIARAIDCNLALVKQPSCSTSDRIFEDITEKTCVLIPGGQKQMPIRKWPWYGELAGQLEDVAVVGLPSDLDMSNRIIFPPWIRQLSGNHLNYQGRWWRTARIFAERQDHKICFPSHVKNYIGKLSLDDTAALIKQAGFVIGNDSGLTHLSVALGKPVFALIGPTSSRKVFPRFLSNVTVISRKYDCQPCHEKPWMKVWRENLAQCFCPYHIRCMNDIKAEDVLIALQEIPKLE